MPIISNLEEKKIIIPRMHLLIIRELRTLSYHFIEVEPMKRVRKYSSSVNAPLRYTKYCKEFCMAGLLPFSLSVPVPLYQKVTFWHFGVSSLAFLPLGDKGIDPFSVSGKYWHSWDSMSPCS